MKFALRSLGGIALYVAAANLLRAPRGGLDDGDGDEPSAPWWLHLSCGPSFIFRAPRRRWRRSTSRASTSSACRARADRSSTRTSPRCISRPRCPSCSRPVRRSTPAAPAVLGPAPWSRRWAALVIVEALSLTASRAAMLTALVVVWPALGPNAFWRKTHARWQAPAVLAMLRPARRSRNTALGSLVGLRLKFWNDDVWYRSTITPVAAVPRRPGACRPHLLRRRRAQRRRPPLARGGPEARRRSATTGATTRRGRWSSSTVFARGCPTTSRPATTVRLHATVAAPPQPGRYRLHLELVHEGIHLVRRTGRRGLRCRRRRRR